MARAQKVLTARDEAVERVVAALQRRGLSRTEYADKTLRENLGLPPPANRAPP